MAERNQGDPAQSADFKQRAKMAANPGGQKPPDIPQSVFSIFDGAVAEAPDGTIAGHTGVPVTWGEPPPQSSAGGDPIVVCTVSSSAGLGFSVSDVCPITGGELGKSIGGGTMFIPELALGASVPSGTRMLAHPADIAVTVVEQEGQ